MQDDRIAPFAAAQFTRTGGRGNIRWIAACLNRSLDFYGFVQPGFEIISISRLEQHIIEICNRSRSQRQAGTISHRQGC